MVDYVYALHDFVPEHDDEVSFKAGDRIEVVEKDDLYGDGWWQGRNLAGKVGLFPKSYTQAAAPAAPAAETSPSSPVVTIPADNVTKQSPKSPTSLQPLVEEPEPLPAQAPSASTSKDTVGGDASRPNGDGEVMRATMTDVQKAIEQLGHTTDDGARSFSFSSTREGDSTDHDTGTDTDAEAEAEDFYRNARQKLAERAKRVAEEREAAENQPAMRSVAPPIDVEVSDESEGEEEDEMPGSPSPAQRQRRPSYIAEEDEDDEKMLRVPSDATQVAAASRTSFGSGSAVDPREDFIVPSPALRDDTALPTATQATFPNIDTEAATERPSSASLPSPVTPGTQRPSSRLSSTPEPARNSRPSSTQAPLEKPSSNGSTVVPIAPVSIGSIQDAAGLLPSPAASSAGPSQAVGSQRSSLQALVNQTGIAQRQTSPSRPPSSHPTDWTVEEVVEWLRSRGFDEGVCEKFIEQEITGDVLLELDVNLLKTELGIPAFGKRMRIANAITELRRPPSVVSSEHQPLRSHSQSQSVSYSIAASSVGSPYQTQPASATTPGSNGLGFASVLSPESPPHTGDIEATPVPEQIRTRRDSDPGLRPRLDRVGESEATIGLGLGIPAALLANSAGGKLLDARPPHLTLSPSDGALATSVKAFSPPIPEEGDERAALSESETAKHSESKPKRKTVFGRSGSNSSKSKDKEESSSRTSKEGSTLSPGEDGTPVRNNSRKRSLDATKGSDRLSIFGGFSGTLGKSRKPPPRYSAFVDNADISTEKSSSTFSRLNIGGPRKSRRPSTSDGSSSFVVTKQHNERRDSKDSKDSKGNGSIRDQAVLRKRTSSAAEPSPKSVVGIGGLKSGQSILQQIGTPDHNGWMRKRGDRYNTWKNRYFVLKGPHLYWLRSNSTSEVKIKGYVNTTGYRIVTDEKVDPGRYGFKIIHDQDKSHSFSSDEQVVIREWMKALMKASIDRDYTKPVVSSVNIPTIPLMVAQAMNPAPRPPSPTARAATQKAMRRENTNQLSTRDAQVLMMNLPGQTPSNTKEGERPRVDSFFTNDTLSSAEGAKMSPGPSPKTPRGPVPARPSREMRRLGTAQSDQTAVEPSLIDWANAHLPKQLQIRDAGCICGGLELLRIAESIKGRPCSPPVPDSAFPAGPNDDKLDGLFRLFDFLLDNDVKMGSVSINDVRLGKRDKIVQLLRALKGWEDKRKQITQSIGMSSMHAGPFAAPIAWGA